MVNSEGIIPYYCRLAFEKIACVPINHAHQHRDSNGMKWGMSHHVSDIVLGLGGVKHCFSIYTSLTSFALGTG